MNAEKMWQNFCQKTGISVDTQHEAWAFGGAPDKLAELVKQGIKTATASGFDLYALDEEEAMPKTGDYSVILNARDEAVCVIQTTGVYTQPFDRVTAEHAYREGEGDRSLAYWRQVHWEFFTAEFREYGLDFDEERLILCEEFQVVYQEEA